MIRGALVCELVSLSRESFGMGDEPSAGKRGSRRYSSLDWNRNEKAHCLCEVKFNLLAL